MKRRTSPIRRAWNILITLVALAILSAGCASKPPVVNARPVVESECKQQVPDRPAMPTEGLSLEACAANDTCVDDYVRASDAEIKVREGYEVDLRAAVVACTTPLEKRPK